MQAALFVRNARVTPSRMAYRGLATKNTKGPGLMSKKDRLKAAATAPTTSHASSSSPSPEKPQAAASSPPTPSKPPPSAKSPLPPSAESPADADTTASPTPAPTTLSLDFAPSSEEQNRERTGARSSKGSLSSIERRRKAMGRLGLGMFALSLGVGAVWLGREWTDQELAEKKITLASAPATRWGRTSERFTSMFDYFSKPIWPELLPPPLPAPHQKPYTLLISLDDLLVTSTWDRQHGWRTAKRPGVDYFIAYLSQFYEVVVFTTQHHYTALPILEKLDPYNFFITYKLFRDATRASEAGPVKDLSYLNRSLDKVLVIDAHSEHVSSHPENAIVVPPWKGMKDDHGLVDLIPFLESIAIYKPPDVRTVLKAYEGKDIPKEYAIKEAENKKAFIEQWRARGGGKGLSSGGFTLSSLFTGGAEKPSPLPLTYLEAKRREAQTIYLEEKKYIEEHKDEFEKLIEADRQAQLSGPIWSNIAAGFGIAPLPGSEPGKEGEEQKEQPKAA